MRVIIAGSRHLRPSTDIVGMAVEAFFDEFGARPTVVLCGCAPGPDKAGAKWADDNNIAVEHYPARWNDYGKRAGPIRNQQMVDKAEGLILIWDGKSSGSFDVLKRADDAKLKTIQLIRDE